MTDAKTGSQQTASLVVNITRGLEDRRAQAGEDAAAPRTFQRGGGK
jgi:hypothetical protein